MPALLTHWAYQVAMRPTKSGRSKIFRGLPWQFFMCSSFTYKIPTGKEESSRSFHSIRREVVSAYHSHIATRYAETTSLLKKNHQDLFTRLGGKSFLHISLLCDYVIPFYLSSHSELQKIKSS